MGKASRRKKTHKGGDGPGVYSVEYVRATQQRASREILGERGYNLDGLLAVAVNAHGWAAQSASGFASKSTRRLACQRGCAWCCHLAVSVFPHEVFLAAAWMRDCLDPVQFEEVRRRVRTLNSETRGMPMSKRTVLGAACPLLEDNACLIYDVRPANCIGWHSYDAALCEAFVKGTQDVVVEGYKPISESALTIAETTAETLASRGAATVGKVELVQALSVALEIPDAGQQWLDGKIVFVPLVKDLDAIWNPGK